MKKIEYLTAYICDDLCRHPREATDQEELDCICAECPVSEHRRWLQNYKESIELGKTSDWKENFRKRFNKVV